MTDHMLVTVPIEGPEKATPFVGETPARGAWLQSRRDPGLREARVERLAGDPRTRERCFWSRLGSFRDMTEVHRTETLELVRKLSSAAPKGYRAELCSQERGWFVMFRGPHPMTPQAFYLDVSDAERIRAHWQGYLPGGK